MASSSAAAFPQTRATLHALCKQLDCKESAWRPGSGKGRKLGEASQGETMSSPAAWSLQPCGSKAWDGVRRARTK